MSLFSDYISEIKCGRNILEIDGKGFVAWIIHKDIGECYIEDMYVDPYFRNKGIFKMLYDYVCMDGKSKDCKIITHSISKKNNAQGRVLEITGTKGYKVARETENEIFYSKELHG